MTEATTLGYRYRLMTPLGSGGMGSVYSAYDRLTGGSVAVKRVQSPTEMLRFGPFSATENTQIALIREFRTLASLRHPNVISVYDYGFDDEHQPFFVMDLLDEPRTILEAGEDQPLAVKLRLFGQMLEALHYLHRRDIIHRDLKPDNVLVTTAGQVKVLDFGLAVVMVHDEPSQGIEGTLAYLAPEIFMGKPSGKTSDLYAVGVIGYELFAGQHPFAAPQIQMQDLIHAILQEPPDRSPLAALPSPLVALLTRLLEKDPAERYTDTAHVLNALAALQNQRESHESLELRESYLQAAEFVGREAELNVLRDALAAATDHNGSLWLVGGESGVGKSRLLAELRVYALVEGVQVLQGQAVVGGGLSYQLWRDALRHLCLSTELTDLEAGVLREAVPDISGLLERAIPDAPPLDNQGVQQRFAATVSDILARQPPTVMVFEDLQWSTESLDVLRYIQPQLEHLPVLIICSYRDDARPTLPADFPDAHVLKLDRFNSSATRRLCEAILGENEYLPEIVTLLDHEAEGNVFFIIEVLRELAKLSGTIDNVGRYTLPKSVFAHGIRHIIQERIERVPDHARPLLTLAAVAGRTLDLRLMQTLAPDADLEHWLSVCNDAAILEVQDNYWRFRHDKLREMLLDGLMPHELSEGSRQVALALEAAYPDDSQWASILSHHWHSAGDTSREAHYARLNAERAHAVGSLNEALQYGNRALALADDTDTRIALLKLLANIHQLSGDFARTLDLTGECLKLAEPHGDLHTCAVAHYELAWVYARQGEAAKAREHGEIAVQLAQQVGDPSILAMAINNLGIALWESGDMDGALAAYQQSLAINQRLGESNRMARNLNNIGWIYHLKGEDARAVEYMRDALAIFSTLGARWYIAFTTANLGEVAFQQGDYAEALGYQQQALDTNLKTNARYSVAQNYLRIAEVYLMQGDAERGLGYFQLGANEAIKLASEPLLLSAIANYAHWLHLQGSGERGAHLLAGVLAHPRMSDSLRRYCQRYLIPLFDLASVPAQEQLNVEAIVEEFLTLPQLSRNNPAIRNALTD